MLELLQPGLIHTPTNFYSSIAPCASYIKVGYPLRKFQPNTTASYIDFYPEPHTASPRSMGSYRSKRANHYYVAQPAL
jgi:hypothetical protein